MFILNKNHKLKSYKLLNFLKNNTENHLKKKNFKLLQKQNNQGDIYENLYCRSRLHWIANSRIVC